MMRSMSTTYLHPSKTPLPAAAFLHAAVRCVAAWPSRSRRRQAPPNAPALARLKDPSNPARLLHLLAAGTRGVDGTGLARPARRGRCRRRNWKADANQGL
nr:unnamed protein product [Digitaria exilis]